MLAITSQITRTQQAAPVFETLCVGIRSDILYRGNFMSVQSDQIVSDAIKDVNNGTQYYWASLGREPALLKWAHGIIDIKTVGTNEDNPICCFEYPILLAARKKYIYKQDVINIFEKLSKSFFKASSFETAWSKVWIDWPTCPILGRFWRPRPGDLVFFCARLGGELNHVVLSLGAGPTGAAEVISFGEGRVNKGLANVTKTTIDSLFQEGYTAVKFVSPPWH